MKNSKNISRLGKQTACGLVTCGSILLFLTSRFAQNAKRQQPKSQNNAAPSSGRQHSEIIRATTSSEGSRVSLTTDQSLNDYEAYRTGDRFYVRIPPTDVPRAQTARGRGFEDLKVQRNADSTVLSFRLQPGATARVEQRSNQLDVVFKAAGATASTSGANGPRTASQQTA